MSRSYADARWEISAIAHDFDLLDVWPLPALGERDEFAEFLEVFASLGLARPRLSASGVLFWIRLRAGALLGWDDATKRRQIPNCDEGTLAERLPPQLRETAAAWSLGGALGTAAGGFSPLYRTDREAAAEIANDTVHGVLHLAWVEQLSGRYQPHLAVYVKPRGRLGRAYLALIQPFRRRIVYPELLRTVKSAWDTRRPAPQEPARTSRSRSAN